jgi:hypothetical protein
MISHTVLADELGALDAELKPYKQKFARAEHLRSTIRALFINAPAMDEHVARGERFDVLAGACGFVSVVDRAGLAEEIGAAKYCAIAVPTLDAIKKNCGVLVLSNFVTQAQIGPRPLAITPRPEPAPAAAAAVKTKTRAVSRKKAA